MKNSKRINTNRLEILISKNRAKKLNEFCKTNEFTKSAAIRLFMDYYFLKDKNNNILNKDLEHKKEVLYELRRYGNNLNQIAYKLNVALKTEDISVADLIEIRQACELINQMHNDSRKLTELANKRF